MARIGAASSPIVVLGTGMAALGAASHLVDAGREASLYDVNAYAGGHTATFSADGGFLFDDGPHVSFTKNERIQDLLGGNVGGAFEEVRARINNYWQGSWIPHPVQMHLHGLPDDLVVKIIRDFVDAQSAGDTETSNYEEWLRAAYGSTFAETFPIVYGRKYHTTSLENLTTDWLGPRMYRPSLEEVLRGALSETDTDVHYVTGFRYPTHGGFQSYLRPWLERFDIYLGHRIVAIDPSNASVRFADGSVTRFDRLVSSIPLPELVPLVVGAPTEVLEAASRLSFSSAVMVNLGVDREDISEAQVSYVYDEDIIFPRLNFPHLLSPNNVPPGAASIQVELYFSDRYKPLEVAPADLIEDTIKDLIRMGVLEERDRLLVREARFVRYANVIYDHERGPALGIVNQFLDEAGILRCGRYGDWNHAWTDEAFVSGELAGERALATPEH